MMHCTNAKYGCIWRGHLQQLNQHIVQCKFNIVKCPNGCGKDIDRMVLEEHLRKSCPKIVLVCDYCGVAIKYIQVHMEECQKYPIQCPHRCSSSLINREDMPQHLENECTEVKVECTFKDVGCRYEGPQFDLDNHMRDYTQHHLVLVSSVLLKQSLEMSSIKSELTTVKTELMTARSKYKSQTDRIDSLETVCESQKLIIEKLKNQMAYEIPNLSTNYYGLEESLDVLEQRITNIAESHLSPLDQSIKKLLAKSIQAESDIKSNSIKIDKITVLQRNTCRPLFWTVDVSLVQTVYSEYFYSHTNGYKLRAFVDVLPLAFDFGVEIVHGRFDEVLPWPFVGLVSFSCGHAQECFIDIAKKRIIIEKLPPDGIIMKESRKVSVGFKTRLGSLLENIIHLKIQIED